MDQDIFRGWPKVRAAGITSRLASLSRLNSLPYRFLADPTASTLSYFPVDLHAELEQWSPAPFRYCRPEDRVTGPQLVVFHSIGIPDEARRLWELRATLDPQAIIVLWMWDNHTAHISNLRSALAADLVFFSHSPHADYLFNPASAVVGHVPACSAQWRHDDAAQLFRETGYAPRRHSLLMNYVEYDFAGERNAVIAAVREQIPEAAMLSMAAGDRRRYFGKSSQERFAEWAQHKTTLILPISEDLSTRLFDALLCGLVPIVPTSISDLDAIVPDEEQQALGIVRIGSYNVNEIRRATQAALQNFDELGPDGMLARHRLVLEHHMLGNRLTALLQMMYMLLDGSCEIRFRDGAHGPALYVGPKT